MGLYGINPKVMRELVKNLLNSQSSGGYKQSCITGKAPEDWKLASVTPICKKGQKYDLGNYRTVSITLVPDKIMEKNILNAITWHV